MYFDVVITGIGHLSSEIALALRARHFEGSIAIVGDRASGAPAPLDQMLRLYWDQWEVTMLTGRIARSICPDLHKLITNTGEEIAYCELVCAGDVLPQGIALTGVKIVEVCARFRSSLPDIFIVGPCASMSKPDGNAAAAEQLSAGFCADLIALSICEV